MIKTGFRLTIFFLLFFFVAFSLQTSAKAKNKTIDDIKKIIPDTTIVHNKVVYVDFWASWCVPCRKSFPWMKELLQKYSDSGLVIITINLDKNRDVAEKFLSENNLKSINIFDPKGKIAESFSLDVMPTSFVYDKSGTFVFKHTGFTNNESKELEKTIVTLLNENIVTDE